MIQTIRIKAVKESGFTQTDFVTPIEVPENTTVIDFKTVCKEQLPPMGNTEVVSEKVFSGKFELDDNVIVNTKNNLQYILTFKVQHPV